MIQVRKKEKGVGGGDASLLPSLNMAQFLIKDFGDWIAFILLFIHAFIPKTSTIYLVTVQGAKDAAVNNTSKSLSYRGKVINK